MIELADDLLYEAKEKGKNCVEIKLIPESSLKRKTEELKIEDKGEKYEKSMWSFTSDDQYTI